MSRQHASSAGYGAPRCPFPVAANYRPSPPFGTGVQADKPPFCLNFQPEKAAVVNWSQYKGHDRVLHKYEMNARRRLLIKLAFDVMDVDGSGAGASSELHLFCNVSKPTCCNFLTGEITVADIRHKYSVKAHPDFLSGAKSEDELLTE
jgi:hypothetical protein